MLSGSSAGRTARPASLPLFRLRGRLRSAGWRAAGAGSEPLRRARALRIAAPRSMASLGQDCGLLSSQVGWLAMLDSRVARTSVMSPIFLTDRIMASSPSSRTAFSIAVSGSDALKIYSVMIGAPYQGDQKLSMFHSTANGSSPETVATISTRRPSGNSVNERTGKSGIC